MKNFITLFILLILATSCKINHRERILQSLEVAKDSLVGIGLNGEQPMKC